MHRVKRIGSQLSDHVLIRLPKPLLSASLCALVFTVVGCSDTPSGTDLVIEPPKNGISAGTLNPRTERWSITLRKTVKFVVAYMVIDGEMATFALFPQCGETCLPLVQGPSGAIPYIAVGWYHSGTSSMANVLWFKYQRDADGTHTPREGTNVTQVTL